MNHLKNQVVLECERIEEDSEQSAKRHFNAASRWSSYNGWLGIPSVVIAGIASAVSFAALPVLSGIFAATAAALTAVLTFLKPAERSASHNSYGNQYLRLRNETRLFREVELPTIKQADELSERFKPFAERRDDLNDGAPMTTDQDYTKANQGILDGQTEYKADKK